MSRLQIRQGRATVAAFLIVALSAAGCSTNPATGKAQLALISEDQEIAMGKEADQQVVQSLGLYQDQELQSYVNRLGQRLAKESERPNLPWTFRVVDDPVVNAFAFPGGYIYVTRGLLSHLTSEAELVSVLGHEIGHVTGRHSVEQMSKQQLAQIGLVAGMILKPELANYGDLAQTGLSLVFLKYGRDDERQADDLGLKYMAREGYDPREMPQVFQTLGRVSQQQGAGRIPGWLSTHPTPENRVGRIQDTIAKSGRDFSNATVNREAYLRSIDDIVFGQNPREGYFRGNTFIQPELAFQIQFPQGWQTSNQKAQVGAISPNQDAIVVVSLARQGSAQAAAREFFSQQGIQQGQAVRADLGGVPAVTNVFGVQGQNGDIQGVASFAELDGKVYQILGYTMASNFNRYGNLLSSAIGTFSKVTDRRLLNVEPRRVDVVTIPSAMTLEEFNRRYPSTVDLETLAIINQVDGNSRFAAGDEVKRVVGGEPA
ncbi:MAG TPA: M48 family metalloprotease [Thermoanaerobaculia bacterium]|jgi:predicted Zn-dependent protease|nr:M48 family metalloprotease [Thermoanaerobaculia bacterium]